MRCTQLLLSRARPLLGALLLGLLPAGCSDPTAPALPKITSVRPAAGALAGGTAITITGARFRQVTGVTVGGTPLENLAVVSTTQLTGLTPASTAPGTVDVVVEADGERRTCQGCFTYHPLITITGVTPDTGLLGGGVTVTITGAHFVDVTEVRIGVVALGNLAVVDSGTITGTVPPATNPGPADVVVISSSHGTGTCQGCFGYRIPVGPGGMRLAAGNRHTCQLDASGAAYCWGVGLLGDGTTTDRPTPVAVSGGVSFVALVAGDAHTCGLTGGGTAYCWGIGYDGQLGDGTIGYAMVPVAVAPLGGSAPPSALQAAPAASSLVLAFGPRGPCLRAERHRLTGSRRPPDSCAGE
jgi:hypothetical protein